MTINPSTLNQPQADPYSLDFSQLQGDSTDYRGLCQEFVEKYTYGQTGIFPTAIDAWNSYSKSGQGHTGTDGLNYGDTIYFSPNAGNGYAGHTAIYLGNGQMLSATDNGVRTSNILDWEKETGQQMLGYIPSTNYGKPPAPQQGSILQSINPSAPQSENTPDANHEFTAAPQQYQAPVANQPMPDAATSRNPYTVKAGDTLSAIAERTLGDANRWKELKGYAGDPTKMPIGTVITPPTQYSNILKTLKPAQTISQPPNANTQSGQPPPAASNGANATSVPALPPGPFGANYLGNLATAGAGELAREGERAVNNTTRNIANAFGQVTNSVGKVLQPQQAQASTVNQSFTQPSIPPSADHLVNPVYARTFNQPSQQGGQQSSQMRYSSQPTPIARAAQTVSNAYKQAPQRPTVQNVAPRRTVAGGGAQPIYNQIGNAVNNVGKAVTGFGQRALGFLANVGGGLG